MSKKTIYIHNVFYKETNNNYRVYDPFHRAFSSMTYQELTKLSHKYEMFQGYELTDQSLLKFYNDFKVWNNELYKHYELKKSHLTFFNFYYSNEFAVIETFNKYSRPVYDLKNNTFEFEYEISNNNPTENRLLTAEQKFKLMAQKNPLLSDLQRIFELQIEY
jgi:hypothetical protein